MAYDDWLAVILNLTKARAVWRIMLRILIREESRPRVSRFFFKAVVQSVFLFGAETWVVAQRMGRFLGFLQYKVAQKLMGQLPRWRSDERWEYTSAEAAREKAEFGPVETYIQRRQNMFVHYIATQPIMGLCEATESNHGGMGGYAVVITDGT